MSHTLKAVDKVELACKWSPSPQGPLSRLLWTCEGPKCPKMASKWAHLTRLCTPNGVG